MPQKCLGNGLLIFCTIYEVITTDATAYRIWSDDKLGGVYATNVHQ